MKKDVRVFYEINCDPHGFFKIKNADLRNQNIVVEYAGYRGDNAWDEFLLSFTNVYRRAIVDNAVEIPLDYKGFVLMYTNPILNKPVIITDIDAIIEAISE